MKDIRYNKKVIVMAIMLCFILISGEITTKIVPAKPIKISVKSKKITQGKSFRITVKNTKKKVKVSLSKKKIVKVKKLKKNRYKVTGLRSGKVVITFKIGKKKYKCRVTVKKKASRPNAAPTEKQTTAEPSTTVPLTTTHVHKYTEEIEVKQPICGTEGYIIYQCQCGKTHKEILNPTVAHKLTGWIIDKKPTYTETGLKHKECLMCYAIVEQETIPKLPSQPLENGGEKTDDNDETVDVGDGFR